MRRSDSNGENLTATLHLGSAHFSLCSLRSLAANFSFRINTLAADDHGVTRAPVALSLESWLFGAGLPAR